MDEKKLPLTSHLQELRKRLVVSFIAWAWDSSLLRIRPESFRYPGGAPY